MSIPTSAQIGQSLYGLARAIATVAVAVYVVGVAVHAFALRLAHSPGRAVLSLIPLKPVRPVPPEWGAILLTDEQMRDEIASYDARTLRKTSRPALPAKARRVKAPA